MPKKQVNPHISDRVIKRHVMINVISRLTLDAKVLCFFLDSLVMDWWKSCLPSAIALPSRTGSFPGFDALTLETSNFDIDWVPFTLTADVLRFSFWRFAGTASNNPDSPTWSSFSSLTCTDCSGKRKTNTRIVESVVRKWNCHYPNTCQQTATTNQVWTKQRFQLFIKCSNIQWKKRIWSFPGVVAHIRANNQRLQVQIWRQSLGASNLKVRFVPNTPPPPTPPVKGNQSIWPPIWNEVESQVLHIF